MIPNPDENRAKVEDEPIRSELLAKLNAGELDEVVGDEQQESIEEGDCDVCGGKENILSR